MIVIFHIDDYQVEYKTIISAVSFTDIIYNLRAYLPLSTLPSWSSKSYWLPTTYSFCQVIALAFLYSKQIKVRSIMKLLNHIYHHMRQYSSKRKTIIVFYESKEKNEDKNWRLKIMLCKLIFNLQSQIVNSQSLENPVPLDMTSSGL